MIPIQPILVAFLLAAAIFCIWSLRVRVVTRTVVVVLAATGTVFVLRPELTGSIAHTLGVGRGADLMFYLFSLACIYAFLIMYVRYRELRRDLTKLTRSIAIEHALRPRSHVGSDQTGTKN
jgi:hypothetical protein